MVHKNVLDHKRTGPGADVIARAAAVGPPSAGGPRGCALPALARDRSYLRPAAGTVGLSAARRYLRDSGISEIIEPTRSNPARLDRAAGGVRVDVPDRSCR